MHSLSFELWTEKYRPKSLDDVVNQKEIVERLKGFVKAKSLPHCLFAGPPGTGKTTAALCLAHDLFGESFAGSFSELNASDERGINVVRERIKTFARTRTLGEIPFKILVLDEADNMTSDAQQALRRTMERYTETCRLILVCNYSSKIIEPIQSRCAPFRFTPLSDEDVKERLCIVAKTEGIILQEDGVNAILEICEGDLRKAYNTLQAAAALEKAINETVVYDVIGRAHPKEVQEMLLLALRGNFIEARNSLRVLLMEHGIASIDIVRQLHSEIFSLNVPEQWKATITDAIGDTDFRLSQGADGEVQLSALLAKLALMGEKIRTGR